MKKVCSTALVLALASGALADGRLMAIDSARVVYSIDLVTGARTPTGVILPSTAGTTGALARDPATGTIYLSSTSLDSLFTVDLDLGTVELVGPYGGDVVMHGLEFDTSTGRLYGGSNGNLFEIDKATGAATQIGASGLTSFLNLGYDPVANIMYAGASSTDSTYTVDLATGVLTLVGPLNGPTNPHGWAYNTDNNTMYISDSGTDALYTLDTATGAAILVGPHGTGNILGLVYIPDAGPVACYANCDESTTQPVLNVADFTCFLQRFAAGESYANCDESTSPPVLNVADFTCFLQSFAAGCP